MASAVLSLALAGYCLAQAGAPLPPARLAPLAALCDEHPEIDAYRRRVVAQGRFFCKEEFPMLDSAASELALRPAFMRLYLVGSEAFGEHVDPALGSPPLADPVHEASATRARAPRPIALPGEELGPLDLELSPDEAVGPASA